jgi:putative nucleotidyltransferase with HDIG domain
LSPYLVIPLVEVAFGLALIIVLMVSGKRHVARRPFSLFLFFMTLWGFFIFMMRSTSDIDAALVWEKLVFTSILTASVFFFWFTVSFTGMRPRKVFLYPLLVSCVTVLALIPLGLVVRGMQVMWYGKAPVIGPLFPLYLLCAYTPLIYSGWLLITHSRRSRVVDEKVRDEYLIAGIIAMFTGATTDYLPVLGISMYPLGIIGNIMFCVIATAAMLKHNLLEMKVILRQGVTLVLAGLLIFGAFGSIIYLLIRLFHDFISPVSITLTMVAVFMAALVFRPVFLRLQKTVDRWFFRERYDHIQMLRRLRRETGGNLDLEQLSSSLVNAAVNGMQALGVYLLLPSPATGNFTIGAYAGQKSRGRLYFAAGSPLATALEEKGIIDNLDIDSIPSLLGLSTGERQALENNRIELLAPMKNNGRLAGMLLLTCKASHEPYTNEERRLLQAVASGAAASIDNANLYENIKQKHSELEKAMDGVVHAMSLVIESRDPYTAGHQRRVAELAQAIGREMGLSEWQVMGLHITGLLHDVGKVAVPSEILSKPGKISQYEYSIIKNHSQVGYEILQKINFPWPVTTAILQHHERLNGSGYPAGISGEDIILEARILGVADVVEAMSSHRPYRPALGLASALAEITKNRGVLYEPRVVDACLRLLENNETAFEGMMAVAASRSYTMETVS